MLDSVLQRKGKGRNGLSAACGNSQCEQAFFQRFSLLVAYVQNFLPAFVQDVGRHLPWRCVSVQVLKQYVEVYGAGWTGFSVKEGFRVQKIGVYQTGEYHSDIHGNFFSVLLWKAGGNGRDRRDFRLVGAVVRNHVGAFSLISAFQRCFGRCVRVCTEVRQSGVVSGNGKSGDEVLYQTLNHGLVVAFDGACRGVVDPVCLIAGTGGETFCLKLVGVFSDVME